MTKLIRSYCTALMLIWLLGSCVKEEERLIPNLKNFMQTTVADASNVIWGVQSFDSVTDWKELEAAVNTMVKSSKRVQVGGVKSNGISVKITPEWSGFALQMLNASKDLKVAISTRNEAAFFDASGRMYPPCEECHIKYNTN